MLADPLGTVALAVEIATLDFANVLSVLVNNAGINPNEPYAIDDFTELGKIVHTQCYAPTR